MALRLTAALVAWLILSVVFGLLTLHFPPAYSSGLFYVLCAACGAPGLLFKSSPWVSIMIVPALGVASAVVVLAIRVGYFGL